MAKLPLLFLPGTLCTGALFSQQAQALKAQCSEVTAADFSSERCIGEMAETAARLIPAGTRAAVAGFSMGGMVALELAERYPERVDRIALLNSNCHTDLEERRVAREKYVEQARRTSLREVLQRGFLRNYLYRGHKQHCDLILDMAEELGPGCFEAQTEALANRGDRAPILRRLTCPVLILGARQDVLCPPEVQLEMHRLCGQSRLEILEECGHFSMLEQPEQVNRALLDWLQQ